MISKTCGFGRSAKSVRAAMNGALASVLALLAFVICTPQLAFADDASQTIDGTMTITLQGGSSGGGAGGGAGASTAVTTSTSTSGGASSGGASSGALTGDVLIWLILGIVVLLAGAVYIIVKSRKLANMGAPATGTSVDVKAGSSAENLTSAKRKTIIVAVITALVACACFGMFASKSNAFAKEGITSISGVSNVVVDEQGNVLSNDLVITNNSGKAILIKNVLAPEELNGWNASIKDEALQSGSSAKGTWDGKTIPASVLEQVKSSSGSSIILPLKITIADTERSLDFENFTVDTKDVIYDGNQIKPVVSSDVYQQGTDYEVTYGENKNVGEGTITINGIGNYQGTKTYTFTISQKELTLNWSGSASFAYEYNGRPHVPTASVDGVIKDDMVIVDVDGAKTEVGTYKAIASIDNNNYKLPTDNTKEFTITKAKITISGITAKDKAYDGTSSAELVFDDITLEGKIDKDDVSITAQGTFSDANAEYLKKVSIANITLTGDASNNYELAEQGQQTSAKASITQRIVELEWGSVELSYSGIAQVPQVKVTNAVQGEKVEVSVATKDGKEAIAAGTYEAIPSALSNNNYALPQDISSRPFTISPAFLAITGIKPAPKTYDATTKANLDTSDLSIDGVIKDDDVSVNAQGTFKDANAGKEKEVSLSYELGGSAKDNYLIDFSASVMSLKADIDPASIDQSKITISSEGTTYTGSQLTPRVTIEGLAQGTDFDVSYDENIKAGKEAGSLTVTGKGNYTGEYSKIFEIKKADPNPTAPEGLTAETGQTLADVTLPRQAEPVAGSFVWEAEDPSKVFVGEADTTPSFNAVFTPDDTDNYNTQVVPVTIKVTKVKSAFAVYFTDGTLGFYHRVDIPKEKDELDNKTVAQVYEKIEDANYQPKWRDKEITSVTVVDTGIQPKSTANWFALNNSSKLKTVDVAKLDTSQTTTMASMFKGCSMPTTMGDLSNWNTENVADMSHMFEGCTGLVSIGDISDWNTGNVITMDSTFAGCSSLDSLGDLSKWKENTANVTNMTATFENCENLTADCTKWAVDNVKDNHENFDTNAPGVQSPWDEPLDFNFFSVSADTVTYNTTQFKPTVTTTASKYKEGEAYEVIYGENKNAGEGTVTIMGLNKYYGEKTYTFTINQKELTLTWGEQTTFTYDGTMHAPNANIDGVIKGDVVNLSVQGAKDAGNHEAKANIDNKNYKLSNASTQSFTINPKQISLTWSGDTFVYNGKPQAPTATAEGVIEGDTVNITVEGAQTNASDTAYTAKATKIDSANYRLTGEATKSFSIQKAEIVVSGITAKDKFYDGTTNAELSYSSVTLAGKVDKDNLTVSAKASFKDANAGTDKEVSIANLTLAGASLDNYKLASEHQQTSATATINPITIDKTITISTEGTTYTGSQLTPQVSIESLKQDKDFTLSFGENIRAGKGAGSVSVTGIGNYTGTQTKYFDIAKANPGYNTPEEISAEVGQILADVVLPIQTEPVKGTFDWKNPSTSVGDKIGTYTFKASFIPEDTNNYNVVENIEIAVKVVEAQEKTAFAVYCAKDNSLNFYNRSSVPTAGTKFDGKDADGVYTDIDKNSYDYDSIPWKDHRSTLKTATVVDTGIDPISLGYWFDDCTALNSVDLTKLNTYNVKSMHHLFYNSAVKQLDLSNFDTSNVTSMTNMFTNCIRLSSISGIANWDTSNVTNMSYLFDGCTNLATVGNISKWNTSKVKDMSSMFNNCSMLSADCSGWNVQKVGPKHTHFNDNAPMVKSPWDGRIFAVYSSDDNSLSFYRRSSLPQVGSKFEGKTVTAIYDDIENTGASKESVPWNEMRKYIKVVEVADTGITPTSTAYWFSDCIYLTSLNISKLNTSKLTNMCSMFSGLNTGASLYSIDLSGLNTSTVTDMSSLFAGSTSLRSITGLSTWDTSSVTNMNSMFSECRMLTSVADLSSWNTENVTDMGSMFLNCVGLTSVGDLSNWKTSKVEDVSSLFENCFVLASIGDLSNWNTSNVLNMSYMFDDCSSLTSIGALNDWDVSKVVNMRCMFYYCTSLVGAEGLSDWKPSSAENMDYMFSDCSKLDVDLSSWPKDKVQEKHYAFNRNASKIRSPWERCFAIYSNSDHSLNFYKRDAEEVPSVGGVFEGKNVTNLYIDIDRKAYYSYWDVPWYGDGTMWSIETATVVDGGIRPVDTSWWFFDCGNMVSADFTKLNTSKTTDFHGMFFMGLSGTSKLTTVGDISNWDTSNVEEMSNMFANCPDLVADCSRWNIDKVRTESYLGNYNFNAGSPHVKSPWDQTTFAVYSETDNSLNFHRTRTAFVPTEGSTYKGKVITKLYTGFDEAIYDKDSIPWAEYRSSIKSVEVVDSDISAKSTAYWFSDCTQLTSVEISKLNTSDTKDMNSMFKNCTSLASLSGLSNLKTSNVTDMSSMLLNCTSLISLEGFDNWSLDKVANLSSMFNGCSKLETIGDISHWNISNIEHIESMFAGCSELRLVGDLSGWNVSKIISMESMFNGCSKLGMLGDLSEWNVSNVKNTKSMFQDCENLISIGSLSDWKTSNIEDMSSMFNNCSRLVAYCSDWDVAKVGDNHTDFNLNAPNVKSPWQTAFAVYSETDHSLNFYERSAVPNVGDVFENKKVTAVYRDIDKSTYQSAVDVPWEDYCTLILSSSVVDEGISPLSTACWFSDCNALTSVDLSKLNTSRVKTMYGMFAQTKLTSLDLSNFNTSNVTDMSFLFYGCSSLTSVEGLSNWDTAKVEDMNIMFYGCSNLTSVGDLSNWNTRSVIFMWGTFNGCAKLATLGDISSWDTSNVGNMKATFKDCKELVVDCSGWNVAGVTENSNFNDGAPNVISPWGDITFALYSETDHSLTFYKRDSTPKAGDTFDSKKVTAVYTNIASDTYTADTVPWKKYSSELLSVKVVDAGVSPVSTAYWFNNCSVLTSVDLLKLKTSNVTNMSNMFAGCKSLVSTDISKLDTSNVTNFRAMFANCSSLVSLGNVSLWSTNNATDMQEMFSECSNLVSLGYVSQWNTSNVTNMIMMFNKCTKLTADCSGWDVAKVSDHRDFNFAANSVKSPSWNTNVSLESTSANQGTLESQSETGLVDKSNSDKASTAQEKDASGEEKSTNQTDDSSVNYSAQGEERSSAGSSNGIAGTSNSKTEKVKLAA